MRRITLTVSLVLILGPAFYAASAQPQNASSLNGLVSNGTGDPIEDVLVVASGVSFGGWTKTGKDGTFRLEFAGKFLSLRRAGYNPVLVRTSSLTNPIHLQMDAATETMRQLEPCPTSPKRRKEWIGGLLSIKASKYKGPVNGEHDSHWYVREGGDILHVVDGAYWHAGLPLEDTLDKSEAISVRGWVFGDVVGLDLSGRMHNGKYWRWVGAPISAAIEYQTAHQASADYFDNIIATACFSLPQLKH